MPHNMTLFEHMQQHQEMHGRRDTIFGDVSTPQLARYTYATRPTAPAFGSGLAIVDNRLWYSDASSWHFFGGTYPLLRTALPMIVPTSGSIGNNGALTGITALPVIYSSGCYMYFPAEAIRATVAEIPEDPGPPVVPAVPEVPGTAAGWYYVVMSSTTAGTIYNNVYTSGTPTIPSSPTAFVTTGPGAFTQVTTEITALSFTLPAGLMGTTGALRYTLRGENSNSSDDKTYKIKFGGSVLLGGVVNTTNTSLKASNEVINITAAKQSIYNATAIGATTGNVTYLAVNTAADVTILVTVQLEAATDFVMIAGALFEVFPT